VKAMLDVDLDGIALRSPVMAASGCLRSLKDIHGLLDVRKLGAIVTPSITLEPLHGGPGPRVAESPSGILTATGFQNPGIEAFLVEELPSLIRTRVPVIVSVGGTRLDEYLRVATDLALIDGIAALEVNLAFPNLERGGARFAHRADHAAEVIGAVSRMTRFPVFAKLSADVADIVDVARACIDAGAHGLTLINGVPGMVIDVDDERPRLAAGTGWVSGPAIRPLAQRAIFDVSQAFPAIPILGCGGISDGKSAVAAMLAGAWAVQVGTAMLVQPDVPLEITKDVLRHLRKTGLDSPSELRGGLRSAQPTAAEDER